MEKYMNKPIDYNWTDGDIVREYNDYKDRKAIAKMYMITVKQVTEILKKSMQQGVL